MRLNSFAFAASPLKTSGGLIRISFFFGTESPSPSIICRNTSGERFDMVVSSGFAGSESEVGCLIVRFWNCPASSSCSARRIAELASCKVRSSFVKSPVSGFVGSVRRYGWLGVPVPLTGSLRFVGEGPMIFFGFGAVYADGRVRVRVVGCLFLNRFQGTSKSSSSSHPASFAMLRCLNRERLASDRVST